jgi:hypothetical protein
VLPFIPKGRRRAEDILDCDLCESLDEVRDAAWEWLL